MNIGVRDVIILYIDQSHVISSSLAMATRFSGPRTIMSLNRRGLKRVEQARTAYRSGPIASIDINVEVLGMSISR